MFQTSASSVTRAQTSGVQGFGFSREALGFRGLGVSRVQHKVSLHSAAFLAFAWLPLSKRTLSSQTLRDEMPRMNSDPVRVINL